ncbi:response regulator transcription factor [Dyadobacter sp. LHD-138]|uniref:response regulator transcription factor n=1 Tax=Dyadobacter sp. LHD-138 TaxID=3071413 RepID=UPI0027E1DD4A|nr:response regulator transcription factor [Dyadobacter sp. LHD-138]MDQ6480560.1 response regulator transcription factor [Dyadobacter sp. LHD-138]
MKRILIVEDHPIMSAGTCQMIRSFLTDAVFTEVDTFWKALHAANVEQFDLVIMDIGIPGGNSVQMVVKFRSVHPNLRLLMFSSFDERIYALPYVKAGATGFISKKASETEFRRAIETVLFRDRIYLSDDVRDLTLNTYIKPHAIQVFSPNVLESLSIREKEVLQLFYARKGVTEIAAHLNLSTSTVNTHRVRIFNKMGVDNIFDLIQKYEQLCHGE